MNMAYLIIRRITGFFVIAVALFLYTPPALAGTETYYLDDLGMNVSVPSDGYVLTRDTDENDPYFGYFDATLEEKLNYLESYSIYLEYISIDPYFELDIVRYDYDQDLKDFSTYTDEEIIEEAERLMNSPDFNYTGYYLNYQGDMKYIVFDGSFSYDDSGICYYKEYYTIYGGREIDITVYAYDTPVSNAMLSVLRETVASISFVAEEEPFTAASTGTTSYATYNIDAMKMNVDIPTGGYVLTRDMDAGNPALAYLDATLTYELDYLQTNSIYLEYISPDPYFELDIVQYDDDSDAEDFNEYTDFMLNLAAEEIIGEEEDASYQIYDQNGFKYLVFERWFPYGDNGKYYSTMYYTITGGREITFSVYTYDTPVTETMKAVLKAVVDSVTFTDAPAVASDTGTDENSPASITNNELIWIIVIAVGAVAALMIVFFLIVIKRQNLDKPRNKGATVPSTATGNQTINAIDENSEVRGGQRAPGEIPVSNQVWGADINAAAQVGGDYPDVTLQAMFTKKNKLAELQAKLETAKQDYQYLKGNLGRITLADIEQAKTTGRISLEQAQLASARFWSLQDIINAYPETIAKLTDSVVALKAVIAAMEAGTNRTE